MALSSNHLFSSQFCGAMGRQFRPGPLLYLRAVVGRSGSLPLRPGLWLTRAVGIPGSHPPRGCLGVFSPRRQGSNTQRVLPGPLAVCSLHRSPLAKARSKARLGVNKRTSRLFFLKHIKRIYGRKLRGLHIHHLLMEKSAYPFLGIVDTFEILMKAI